MLGILGVELGASAVRGVIYDPDREEIILAAECPLSGPATVSSGALNDQVMIPALDDVLYNLGVTSPATIRSGVTIGPDHGGVGSGPALHDWLRGKSNHIGQPISYAGNIGISFAPLRAIEDAQRIASESGLVPDRVELAPVAAARVLGNEVEDVITIGSGRGWRARMRRYEVLEAVTSDDVTVDEPLRIVTSAGKALEVEKYSSVTIADSLSATSLLDLGQLAVCVGAALGVAYDSGGNLLVGQVLGEENQGLINRVRKSAAGRERQAATDFFTRSPRDANVDLVAAKAKRAGGEDQVSEDRFVDESADEFGYPPFEPDPAPTFSVPQYESPIEDSYVDSQYYDGQYQDAPYQDGQPFYDEDATEVGPFDDREVVDPYANSYAEPPTRPVPEMAPYAPGGDYENGLAPTLSPEDLMQTYHEPAGAPLHESFDRPSPQPVPTDNYSAPTATATAPPPSHRDIQNPVYDEPERPGIRRDRSRGSNQPALVSNDALISQFSPEDAEDWAEQSRSGLKAVIVLLVVSAVLLALLYLFL